jgi:hypothetical protein
LADFELELEKRLFELGVGAFEMDVADLRERLDDERNQIDLLEELEGTLTVREFAPADLQGLVDLEEAWPVIAQAFDHLTSAAGGIRLKKMANRDAEREFSYSVDPALKTIPLMPAHHQDQLISLLPGRRTFDRSIALTNPDAHLVRVGDPLVDWIESYLRIDEGGQTRAEWMYVPGWSVPQAWFCFDFLLEFDETTLEEFDFGTRRRLRRRGDAFLPPRMERVWTDGNSEAPSHMVNSLLEPSSDTDVNVVALRGPRWARALSLFPSWSSLCRQGEQRARELIAARQRVIGWREAAEAAATEEATRRQQGLQLWADRLPRGHQQDRAQSELDSERLLGAEVVTGVKHPRNMLFTVGGVIVAGVPLDD